MSNELTKMEHVWTIVKMSWYGFCMHLSGCNVEKSVHLWFEKDDLLLHFFCKNEPSLPREYTKYTSIYNINAARKQFYLHYFNTLALDCNKTLFLDPIKICFSLFPYCIKPLKKHTIPVSVTLHNWSEVNTTFEWGDVIFSMCRHEHFLRFCGFPLFSRS